METLIGNIGSWGGWVAGYVVPFLFVLTIVVFFHELGHFLIARWAACACSRSRSVLVRN